MMNSLGTKTMLEHGLDPVALDRLRGLGGDQLVREMIDIFLEHTPTRIEAAFEGGEAGNLDAVVRAAHSLASSAGHLGAMGLKDVARRLEHEASDGHTQRISELLADLDAAFQQARTWLEAEKKGLTG
jgi:HPt (histidine-containing phosphotransfer) domain-containing protein